MRSFNLIRFATVFSIAAILSASSHLHAVTVTPSNLGDWAFYETDSSGIIGTGTGTGDIVSGPATPPLGTGSARLQTAAGEGDGSVQLRNDAFAGTRLDALTELKYSTYAVSWNGQQLPYLTIWLDTDNDSIRDDRLWFEPAYSEAGAGNGNPIPQPNVALNTWQQWNVLDGMVYNDNGPSGPGSNAISFSAYVAANPDATILNDAGQSIGGIRITSGFAGSSDNFEAYVDAFTIGTALGSTTYNFESVPEPTSMILFGMSAVGSLFLRPRRKA